MLDHYCSSSSSKSSTSSSTSMSSETYVSTPPPTIYTRLSFEIPNIQENNSLTLKPHRSSDFSYSTIANRRHHLTFRDFLLIRRIGSGDIGTVYLCRLSSSSESTTDREAGSNGRAFFAMKVVDREAVAVKKKSERAEMERKILKMLDHPFLPTLYAEFEASHFSCFVMEYCSGGDLHSLRHKQPLKRFSLSSARYLNYIRLS